jgi:V/A-type H+-transporting ATPase subunit I
MPLHKYYDLPEDIQTVHIGQDKSVCRFLFIGDARGRQARGLPPEAAAVALPRVSTAVLRSEVQLYRKEIADIEKKMADIALYRLELAACRKRLARDLEFETVLSAMNLVRPDGVGADAASRGALAWLEGYVPVPDVDALQKAAAGEHWAMALTDPDVDDPVPTKLKNNKVVSLIYPLTDFLETVPGYNEVDISGWFLLFFTIFFGMIFGDAGYGGILTLIALTGIAKTAKKGVPQALMMMLLLSLSNLAWGVVTCTWFGLDAAALPEILRSLSIPAISGATAALSPRDSSLVSQNLQIVCFSLALVQLNIAHIMGCIKYRKSLKIFSELGSIAMLVGMYNVVLSLVVSNNYRSFPFLPQSLYLLVGGFALTFLFANYEGSIFKSILTSLQNVISVILGVTNVFSDIMSYIRLWAVGLAGASISATVNSMAGPLLGNFLVFLGILLLVFGHGLNIVLNMLSVLVHGVRLNTLEFSGHLGLTWSGIAYKPFSEAVK